jgi:hypothetical protein
MLAAVGPGLAESRAVFCNCRAKNVVSSRRGASRVVSARENRRIRYFGRERWADYREAGWLFFERGGNETLALGCHPGVCAWKGCSFRDGGKIFCLCRFFHSDRNCWKDQFGLPDGLMAL